MGDKGGWMGDQASRTTHQGGAKTSPIVFFHEISVVANIFLSKNGVIGVKNVISVIDQ
jgi:hypothetical protein